MSAAPGWKALFLWVLGVGTASDSRTGITAVFYSRTGIFRRYTAASRCHQGPPDLTNIRPLLIEQMLTDTETDTEGQETRQSVARK